MVATPTKPSIRPATRVSWINVSLLLLPVMVLALMGYRRRWVSEDAFITLRVVENFLAGRGPVFNIDERVEVYTHPIWAGMLALWGLPGLPVAQGAAYLGLLCAMGGLGFGLIAAVAISQFDEVASASSPEPRLYLPLGGLVFIAIPVTWDFATSGLETGLALAWLGFSFWLLVRQVSRRAVGMPIYLTACVIGLGILVRPDLFIYSAAFMLVLLVVEVQNSSGREWITQTAFTVGSALLIPMFYQLFRMGYFAALVPNTALAKEAGRSNWPQGWQYLRDFAAPYWLWFPLLLLGVWLGWKIYRLASSNTYQPILLLVAPVLAGLLHTLYIVRLGGDFMHGRMLLPALFALLLPVMVVSVSLPVRHDLRSQMSWAAAGAVLFWVVVCSIWLRWPNGAAISEHGIADERAVYVSLTGEQHPITLDDYAEMRLGWVADGMQFQVLSQSYPRLLLQPEGEEYPLRTSVDSEVALVAVVGNIGITGLAAGENVHLVDFQGIGDPIASRMTVMERGRPGHEKFMPPFWARARFEDEASIATADPVIGTAATVLRCGDIAKLLAAIEDPLTPGRFLRNILLSPHLTRIRINPNPVLELAEHGCAPGD